MSISLLDGSTQMSSEMLAEMLAPVQPIWPTERRSRSGDHPPNAVRFYYKVSRSKYAFFVHLNAQHTNGHYLTGHYLWCHLSLAYFYRTGGVQGTFHPNAEFNSARAGKALGVPFIFSTASSESIEEIAEVNGDGHR